MTRSRVPSSQVWLGDLPAEWVLTPSKALFHERREPNGADDVHLTPSLTHGVLPQAQYLALSGGSVVQNVQGQNSMKHVEPNDFILHLRSFQGGIEWSAHSGKVSSAYTVLEPHELVVPAYFRWLLKSGGYVQELRTTTNQLRDGQSIRFGDFAKIPLPVPPADEQLAIARYLDREVSRIDTLISQQRRLVELLCERREAAIKTVLQLGLDPNVTTVDSGVPGLGRVPESWLVVPTRYLCTITTGGEDSGNATDDGEYPFYVRGREILRIGKYSFDCEAVMTPGDGQGGTGKVFHYVNGKFEAHQRVYVFKDFSSKIRGRYFYHFLSAYFRHIALAGANTVTMESLRRPLLTEFKVAVPPISEQDAILADLDYQTAKIDALIEESERFIELASERRAAVITAAVTGQIDLRDAVIG